MFFYVISLTYGIRGLVGLTQVFIDEKLMELPIGPVLQVFFFFFVKEGIKYIGGGRIFFLAFIVFILLYSFFFIHFHFLFKIYKSLSYIN
jgi:hypothetical protein